MIFDKKRSEANNIVVKNKDSNKFLYTIEFFPQEGKYHFDGHRQCDVRLHPKESIAKGNICPKCGRKLTIGVLHRIEELADRKETVVPENSIGYKSLIPLEEIISDALQCGKGTSTVEKEYFNLINEFGNEFDILLNISEDDLCKHAMTQDSRIVQGIMKVRQNEVDIIPGYDGVYGTIKIRWPETEQKETVKQLDLF